MGVRPACWGVQSSPPAAVGTAVAAPPPRLKRGVGLWEILGVQKRGIKMGQIDKKYGVVSGHKLKNMDNI